MYTEDPNSCTNEQRNQRNRTQVISMHTSMAQRNQFIRVCSCYQLLGVENQN